jgi:nucleoside-diphosphate-sugar epimerase
MSVLVTGASGFVGRHVVAELFRRSFKIRAAVRPSGGAILPSAGVELVGLSGTGFETNNWKNAVAGCSAVIHLAALAHVGRDKLEDTAMALNLANVDFARACAEAASGAGVKRFIFMSSVGVHGGASGAQAFRADSVFAPHTPYSQSKADGEMALTEAVGGTGMALTIIRPPLVYGPGAPGNFGALMRAVKRGWPLPLGAVTGNRRSYIAIDNLVDLIVTCLDHPGAANQAFLVSDGEDLSTADLLQRLGSAIGRPARLLPLPVGAIALGTKLLGKPDMFQKLCGSLQVDMNKTVKSLGWCPPIGVDEGLRRSI